MAWSVRIDEPITHHLVEMDEKTMTEFVLAMTDLRTDPYKGTPHGSERYALPLGDLGIVVYMLLEEQQVVAITDLVWTGL